MSGLRLDVNEVIVVDERFSKNRYSLRRKFFKIFGNEFHFYDERDQVVLFCEMKGLKLKEDLRIYGSEDRQEELLKITTDQILDIGATYNVVDSRTGEHVGSLKRKGLKSLVRDEWVFLDPEGDEVGTLTEESFFWALFSRFLNLIPQTYRVQVDGRTVATYEQNFNPFLYRLRIDLSEDPHGQQLDRRLALAAAVLLGGIEGKQN